MKRLLSLLLMVVAVSMAGLAENYPYRSDYLWVTVPDHDDWLYRAGEKARVEVQLYKYGIPQDATVNYEIADDMLAADRKGEVVMKHGRAVIDMGTRNTPGFRDLRLSAVVDGKKYVHHVKVGFSVDEIRPFTREPADFIDFWNRNIEDMRAVPLSYTKEKAEEYCTDKIDCYLLKIRLNKQNQSVYAYLFYPKNAQKGSCPVVLCPPGAGIKTIKEPLRHKYYAENGFIRMEMEIHGLDPRLPKETFDDITKAFNGRENGYLYNGLQDPDRYYMKRVYLSLIRCLDLLTALPEWDGRNLIVQGGSQGGALAIVAAGLDRRVTQCIVNHPALSDMAAYSAGRTGGYPHFNKVDGMFTDRNMRTMAYYDVVNFARHVTADVYMTWGYNDNTCPPTTSYAVWNTFTCPKEALITPINEHWTSDDTEYRQMEWVLKKLR
ncbi:acetylxylan esterase [Marseilla massiliensis]|uniref:Acetylxylan esterase n=1 Tax=Marseilla massiliensis TaxID=1841864 RepID=A0A938WVR7_9BACT|nr:acetylxylan esterase [Marseilla massiliensis]MBM6674526.1 acetylxylan esterase [Marseilla massiliensis]